MVTSPLTEERFRVQQDDDDGASGNGGGGGETAQIKFTRQKSGWKRTDDEIKKSSK